MKTRDPVCGMTIDASEASETVDFNGQTFYFCSEQCRLRFEEDPERFVDVGSGGDPERRRGHRHL